MEKKLAPIALIGRDERNNSKPDHSFTTLVICVQYRARVASARQVEPSTKIGAFVPHSLVFSGDRPTRERMADLARTIR